MKNKQIIAIILLLGLLAVLPIAIFLSQKRQETRSKAAGTGDVTISVLPATANIQQGNSLTAQIVLTNVTTSSKEIYVAGVDLSYDPNFFAISNLSCGSVLANPAKAQIDTNAMYLSCFVSGGTGTYTIGAGGTTNSTVILGTFTVTAKSGAILNTASNINVIRTNIPDAISGTDIANIGAGAKYTIVLSPTATPTVTPAKTVTPTTLPVTFTPIPTSTPTRTPTPATGPNVTPSPRTIFVSTDTYVDDAFPTTNYCSLGELDVDGSPVRIAYMKFDLASLSGQSITSARLWLRVSGSSTSTQAVKTVTDDSWDVCAINYNTRPALGSQIATNPGGTLDTWVPIDITSYVQTEAGSIMSIGIDSTGTDSFYFFSQENATYRSYLEIIGSVATSPALTPTRTPTPTPMPTTPTPTRTPTFTPIPSPTITSTPIPTETPIPTPTEIPLFCPDANLGNLNCDSIGIIDESDLSILLTKWYIGVCPAPTPFAGQSSADLNGDCNVDEVDLSRLLINWKSM